MRLDTSALALAAGLTTSVVYAICSLLAAIAPGSATAILSYIIHLDLAGLVRPLTWGSFAAGIICLSLAVSIVVALLGALYNRLAGGPLAVPTSPRTATHHG